MIAAGAESFILKPASITERLPIRDLFPAHERIEVELGAGDGSFLAAYARAHPDTGIFGVERLLGRLRKIDRKARRAGLDNIRLMRIEAGYFARYLLPANSVSAVHIYFPDPWPKRRHWKNRLITAEFVETLRTALTPGGVIHLRTDDLPYFAQMLESFAGNTKFEKFETPAELREFITDFERGFHARGVSTNHASYRRLG